MTVARDAVVTPPAEPGRSAAPASEPAHAWQPAPAWQRAVAMRLLMFPLLRAYCGRVRARGIAPESPVVLVANHASHADTIAVLRVLPARIRARTHPAAAADVFFATRSRGRLARAAIGAFPFSRRGPDGLAHASALLARGRSVLLFPEGTRSADGTIAPFRRGVGLLARAGATIVPVGIAGTHEVLPKGAAMPRRGTVVVVVGEPMRLEGVAPDDATAAIERAVRALAARARLERPALPTWYARARAFASGPRAAAFIACWAAAEAVALQIVPDVAVALLAVALPGRALALAAAALVGSLAGGAVAYAIGAAAPGTVAHLPLVTDRMAEAAVGWLGVEGAAGVAHQPWSGVPFKAFATQAHAAGVPPDAFLAWTALARGLRFVEVAVAFAAVGALGRLRVRGRRTGERFYAAFAIAAVAVFAVGLARVVASWS